MRLKTWCKVPRALTDYSKVNALISRYKSVNFGTWWEVPRAAGAMASAPLPRATARDLHQVLSLTKSVYRKQKSVYRKQTSVSRKLRSVSDRSLTIE